MLAEWAVACILGFIAFGVLRHGASHFGLEMFGWRDVLAMVGALVGNAIATGIASRLFSSAPGMPDLRSLAAVPISLRIILVLTAGICEEFMYRGFGIEEIAHFTGNRWIAGGLSLVFFTFGHLGRYGWSAALLIPAIAGGFLTLLYLWRRNLPICMLMHAIIDATFVVVIPEFGR